jgi:hypothetical protein
LLWIALACSPLWADDLVGTVKDADGKPIAGARIDISTAGPKEGRGMFCPSCYLDCKKWTKSDADGNFVLENLDDTLKFHLLATSPGKATTHTDWIDPASGSIEIQLTDEAQVDEDHLLLGKVVDAHNLPVAGALVSPYGAKNKKMRWWGRIDAATEVVTDDEGRFRMPLNDDFEFLEVQVTANASPGAISAELKPGATEHVVRIPTGTTVRGTLVNAGVAAINQPIAVVQLDRGTENIFIKAVLGTTDIHGNFEFNNLPAGQSYVVFTPRGLPSSGLCVPSTIFAAGGNGGERDLGTLGVACGFKLSGKLVSTDNEPLPEDLQLALGRDPAWDLIEVPVQADGSFTIDNLPSETYSIRVNGKEWIIDEGKSNYHLESARSFAWALTKDKTDLEIPLRKKRADEAYLNPTAYWPDQVQEPPSGKQSLSGIIVDPSGNPLSGIQLIVETASYNHKYNGPRSASAADGTFSFSDLPDERVLIRIRDDNTQRVQGNRYLISFNHPGCYYPTLNQQDIRIVFDPKISLPIAELSRSSNKKLVKPKSSAN